MGTQNVCRFKEIDKNYTGCNLKTTELLDCALIAACAEIRSNTVFLLKAMEAYIEPKKNITKKNKKKNKKKKTTHLPFSLSVNGVEISNL